jgi:hypothetical protein
MLPPKSSVELFGSAFTSAVELPVVGWTTVRSTVASTATGDAGAAAGNARDQPPCTRAGVGSVRKVRRGGGRTCGVCIAARDYFRASTGEHLRGEGGCYEVSPRKLKWWAASSL